MRALAIRVAIECSGPQERPSLTSGAQTGRTKILASAISSTCSWWKPFDVAAEPYTNIFLRVAFASSRADVKSFWIYVQRIPGTSDEVSMRASGTKHTPFVIYVGETAVWRPQEV